MGDRSLIDAMSCDLRSRTSASIQLTLLMPSIRPIVAPVRSRRSIGRQADP